MIGEGFFFFKSLKISEIIIKTSKIIMPIKFTSVVDFMEFAPNKICKKNVKPVDKIKATITGLMHFKMFCTGLNFNKFLIAQAINKMIIKEGKTTPSVARNDPQNPPCEEPTNVAILIAIGPGVDSAIAIKSKNSSLFNNFFLFTNSFSKKTNHCVTTTKGE